MKDLFQKETPITQRDGIRRRFPFRKGPVVLIGMLLLLVTSVPVFAFAISHVGAAASMTRGMQVQYQGQQYQNQTNTQSMANSGMSSGTTSATIPVTGTSSTGCVTLPANSPTSHPLTMMDMDEHNALMALVPTNQATNVAVQSGSWSSASTWRGGVPAAKANVYIPTGMTVTYDTQNAVALHTLRVDGTLQFSTTQSTKMLIDTFIVSQQGTLTIGTQAHPMPNNVTASVTFSSGAINATWDPMLMSRGLISEGNVTMCGAAKTTFLPLAGGIKAGQSTLQVSKAPLNWQVGDIVVLTGSQVLSNTPTPYRTDEQRTIKAISGTTITLNAPVTYDHIAPYPGLSIYIANYSHNIAFQSASTLSDDASIQQRGDIMFMHSGLVSVNYVQLTNLGRTNKALWADDPGVKRTADLHSTPGTGTNPRGRYALHFHHRDNVPAAVRGVSVLHGAGWGIVNHQSNVLIEDSATWDVLGGGFVAEDGTEIGAMLNNIAIGSNGDGVRGIRNNTSPHTATVLQDMWSQGTGFAFRGQLIKVEGNVSANQAFEGFAWDNWDSCDQNLPMAQMQCYQIPAQELPNPALANGASTVTFSNAPISDFSNNVAFVTRYGTRLEATGRGADARNMLQNITIWNTYNGILLRYSPHTTIHNAWLYDTNDRKNPYDLHSGILLGPAQGQFVLDNVHVTNFHVGIDNKEGVETGDEKVPAQTWVLNSTLSSNDTNFASTDTTYLHQGTKQGLDLNQISFSLEPGTRMWIWPGTPGHTLIGTITDALGSHTTAFDGESNTTAPGWDQELYTDNNAIRAMMDTQGYYTHGATTYLVLQYVISNRITGAYTTLHVAVTFKVSDWNPKGRNLGQYPGKIDQPVGGV